LVLKSHPIFDQFHRHPILVKYGVAFFSLMHGIPPHFKQQIWGWQLSKVKWGGKFFTTNGPEGHSISNWWVFCVSRFVPEKIKTVAIAVGKLNLHTLSVEYTVEKV
jgi:hypothetical protein